MNSKDYLILTKGRAVCLVLDTARYVLADIEFDDEAFVHLGCFLAKKSKPSSVA